MGTKLDLNILLSRWKEFATQYGIQWKNSFLSWELPKNIEADFALTLALPISYKVKKNPQEIAQEIIKITDYPNLEYNITEQGYINFRFPTSYYQQFLIK